MVDIREVPEADIDRALELAYLVFHDRPDKEGRERHHDVLRHCLRIGAYDGDALVGFMAAHDFRLSVPGADLPCPGLTFVSVAPTHRRRGVLTALMGEVLRRAGAAGSPIAALWASEAAIYGRFGYGSATHGTTIEIDSTRPLALRIGPDRRPLRLVDPADAVAVIGPYHEAARARRAGRPTRTAWRWTEEWLTEEDEEDDELGPPRIIVLGEPGGPVAGYVLYRTKPESSEPTAGSARTPGLVQVYELEADTPAVAAALWECVTSLDLTGKVNAWGRPVDDPLLHFAADRDQVRVTEAFPALWLRLVDVAAALTGRSWAAPVELVLELTDVRLPANAGRFRLKAGPDGAAYEPADGQAPDLTLDVRELAACYLGGTRAVELVAAGLVAEHTPGAAAALDAGLRTALLPHTADEF
ncbi:MULTISPECIES: GNAT family N-acetyltransferase [unclassified Streptomyces]|uniref:GNAT family N-acetyltransferase n=1 Tax=unclassified Streptomyces TaxID=2593676 RepID=UPI000DC7B7E8|nr:MULTISPECIES: GNAT family N-acetyltransferase [unclassified Streptomyces]AWZ08076.1 GNAT family N-acetyltransferase [Streptomyces sp. ICC4]AWZ15848.1 GNAT family N-acetyltransferase [Streptomyces sp. ICC1]